MTNVRDELVNHLLLRKNYNVLEKYFNLETKNAIKIIPTFHHFNINHNFKFIPFVAIFINERIHELIISDTKFVTTD